MTTLGQLLEELESSDRTYQANMRLAEQAERDPILNLTATYRRVQAAALKFQADDVSYPGINRIEAICDREWGTGLTPINIRKLRGELCQRMRCDLDRVNALSLQAAADEWNRAGAEPILEAFRQEPCYPEPPAARLEFAIQKLTNIEQYFVPESAAFASLLVRALLARNCTTSEALWAIYSQILSGRYEACDYRKLPSRYGPVIGEHNPPAGLEVKEGVVHIDDPTNPNWGMAAIILPSKDAPLLRSRTATAGGNKLAEAIEVVRRGEVIGTIFRSHSLPGSSPEQARREALECTLSSIEQWRAHLSDNDVTSNDATRLAYLANAYERELWPSTVALSEYRTFLSADTLAMIESIRTRILAELNVAAGANDADDLPNAPAEDSAPARSVREPAGNEQGEGGDAGPPSREYTEGRMAKAPNSIAQLADLLEKWANDYQKKGYPSGQETLGALSKAALSIAHRAEIGYDAADRRIKEAVEAAKELLAHVQFLPAETVDSDGKTEKIITPALLPGWYKCRKRVQAAVADLRNMAAVVQSPVRTEQAESAAAVEGETRRNRIKLLRALRYLVRQTLKRLREAAPFQYGAVSGLINTITRTATQLGWASPIPNQFYDLESEQDETLDLDPRVVTTGDKQAIINMLEPWERFLEIELQQARQAKAPPTVASPTSEGRSVSSPTRPGSHEPTSKERADGSGSRDNTLAKQDEATKWISLAEASKLSAINAGVISRAVDSGEIVSNGQSGKGKRKVDSADFNRWVLKRNSKPERPETDAEILQKLKRFEKE
jgi:hypothetical protein